MSSNCSHIYLKAYNCDTTERIKKTLQTFLQEIKIKKIIIVNRIKTFI